MTSVQLCLRQLSRSLLNISQCQRRSIPSTFQASKRHLPVTAYKQKSSQVKETEETNGNNLLFKGMETEFPCVSRTNISGPEPQYDLVQSGYEVFTYDQPFYMKYGGRILPQLDIAYETWGELNEDRDNTVMIFTGLSASSHARSHKKSPEPGWWEKFIGPGHPIDTDKYFVICTNNIGGCYGSSGPSSLNPSTGKPFGTTFPLVSVEDMVHSSFLLLDYLGIKKLHGCLGSSLGGMISLMSAALYPDRVGRMISISSCSQSHPSSIAMRYLQRKIIMMDPNWNNGHYYDHQYPAVGMKLAREIATMTYRSGPEWNKRFGRQKIDPTEEPTLCPTFSIESYLEYQGESFSRKYDPNSLLYISKAMDLFDIQDGFDTLTEGLARVACPCMVIGVKTDILFPVWQQRNLAESLQEAGNEAVTYYELSSIFGHDTFLLDLNGVGSAMKGFLETNMKEYGRAVERKREA
ncbi:uncharacterized protein LOC106867363 [Octopus bimaculoides]|uniref:AB hydrolase-1 domain-containing protein n=1 Tax=Octopus bimaculoides TaxID=37653 RepID=A0A0L8I294_OCTBM|nr:uncharacterized protein LOC106867363 [Octopus bimaculoides]|eukprot:XP_014767701.1 PREDICTED: homoserine O-acetyltransferase-like [Octopus bimaculoides]